MHHPARTFQQQSDERRALRQMRPRKCRRNTTTPDDYAEQLAALKRAKGITLDHSPA